MANLCLIHAVPLKFVQGLHSGPLKLYDGDQNILEDICSGMDPDGKSYHDRHMHHPLQAGSFKGRTET